MAEVHVTTDAKDTATNSTWRPRRGSERVDADAPPHGASDADIGQATDGASSDGDKGLVSPVQRGLAFGPLSDYIWSTLFAVVPLDMRYSTQIKPISYLKANAAEVLQELAEQRKPMIITQNGEARAVIQDVASYEETQETLALLKILALGNQQVAQGKVKPVADVAKRLRDRTR